MVTGYIETSKIEDATVKESHASDKIKDIEGEMTRLTKAYRKNRITEEEYDKDYEALEIQLEALKRHLEPILERDLTIYQDLLKSDWKGLYDALNKENKRAFWRKYIKAIELNDKGTVKRAIFF
jgi:chromosome segregation ATPase